MYVCTRARDTTIYRVSYRFKTISLYRYKVKPYRYIAYRDILTYRGLLTFLTIKLLYIVVKLSSM